MRFLFAIGKLYRAVTPDFSRLCKAFGDLLKWFFCKTMQPAQIKTTFQNKTFIVVCQINNVPRISKSKQYEWHKSENKLKQHITVINQVHWITTHYAIFIFVVTRIPINVTKYKHWNEFNSTINNWLIWVWGTNILKQTDIRQLKIDEIRVMWIIVLYK